MGLWKVLEARGKFIDERACAADASPAWRAGPWLWPLPLQFGAGLERRWSRFALQFEVRAVGVAPHEIDEVQMAPAIDVNTMEPYRPSSEPGRANDGMAGGQFVFSGNYYF